MPAGGGLTWIGLIWALLSTIATALIVGGLLTPEWLIGTVRVNDHEISAYFGAYKRCNYPVFDREANRVALVSDCGRYESFSAVPSHFWQLAIISAASGSSLSLLLVLLLLPSICMRDIVTNSSALIVGFFQIIAAVLVSAALVLYPLGWDNPEVRDACGPKASRFNLGACKLGRAYLSMVVGSGGLVFCALLSLCGGQKTEWRTTKRREDGVIIQGYENTRLDLAK